ncbi:Flp pilus assembly protein TadB [Modestobacter sp. DSM 44400]|uniref:type II secretion system F family protein n=1 Tax=Modestobacter sp. DSM 44400 TaxID=1550230 RepID=UPI00089BF1F5|nr:type II secretion system F family protein [Modestobacter sp. DSM 44400]SDY76635.1 Flp pilus assembly protein TadB [Modestobacter sp. DSM 44400]
MTPFLAAVAAMCVLGGLLLIMSGTRRRPALPAPTSTTLVSSRLTRSLASSGRLSRRTRLLLLGGFVVGLLLWLVTGWVIAVLVLPAIAVLLPTLLVTSDGTTSIARLEAMEEWSRSLAGVLTVGVGLEQALVATLKSAPDPIRPEVATLVARLRARWNTELALRAFADDLNDLTGDQIASSLMLGARRRGAGLASVLEGMAQTVADDVRIRRAIEADRAKPRSTARWITLITLGVLTLLALNGSYVAPYGTPLGQAILLLLLAAYLACLVWMRNIAKGEPLPRFIGEGVASRQGPA